MKKELKKKDGPGMLQIMSHSQSDTISHCVTVKDMTKETLLGVDSSNTTNLWRELRMPIAIPFPIDASSLHIFTYFTQIFQPRQ